MNQNVAIAVAEKRFNTAAIVSAICAFIGSRFVPVAGGLWGTGIFLPLLSISTLKIGCQFFYSGTNSNGDNYQKWYFLCRMLFLLSMTFYTSTMISRDVIVHSMFFVLSISSYIASLRCLRILYRQTLGESVIKSGTDLERSNKYLDIVLGTRRAGLPPAKENAANQDNHVKPDLGIMESFFLILPTRKRPWLAISLSSLLGLFLSLTLPSPFRQRETFLFISAVLVRFIAGKMIHGIPARLFLARGGFMFRSCDALGTLCLFAFPLLHHFVSDEQALEIAATFAGMLSWMLMAVAVCSFQIKPSATITKVPSFIELSWALAVAFMPIILASGAASYAFIEFGSNAINQFLVSKPGYQIIGAILASMPAAVLINGSLICGPMNALSVLLLPLLSGPLVSLSISIGWILYT